MPPDTLADSFGVHIAKIRFCAPDGLTSRQYLPAALRAGLGNHLKRTVCIKHWQSPCEGCAIRNSCAYGGVFDPALPSGHEARHGITSAPARLMLVPDRLLPSHLPPGSEFDLELRLLGDVAHAHAEVLLNCLRRSAARLPGVSGGLQLIHCTAPAPYQPVTLLPDRRVLIEFITPLRIERAIKTPPLVSGRTRRKMLTVAELDSTELFLALAKRATMVFEHCLGRFDHGIRIREDVLPAAQRAQMHKIDLREHEEWRHPFGQGREVPLGGLIGRLLLADLDAPLRHLLVLGQVLGLGKQVVFGHGNYRLLGER